MSQGCTLGTIFCNVLINDVILNMFNGELRMYPDATLVISSGGDDVYFPNRSAC